MTSGNYKIPVSKTDNFGRIDYTDLMLVATDPITIKITDSSNYPSRT